MPPFSRKASCPSVETLLTYSSSASSLNTLEQSYVSSHIVACDFCGATIQLLAHHAPNDEAPAPVPIPPIIMLLSESILPLAQSVKKVRVQRAA